MSAFLWMEKPLHNTYWLPCRVSLAELDSSPTPTPPPIPKFIWGCQMGRGICVQTTDSVAFQLQRPGYKSWPNPQAKTIFSTKSFFLYITRPLQSLRDSEALMRNGSWVTQARLKVGWGAGRMRGTQPGQSEGNLSRKSNKHDFWPLEIPCVPVPIMMPWGKYPFLNATKKCQVWC